MVDSLSNVNLGTCGWSYKEWEGNFYAKGSSQSKLHDYTQVFKTAEIDSTFYRNPTKGTVMGWNRYSPNDFMFSAKLPKAITHTGCLGITKNIDKELQEFTDLMKPLQETGKLAALLIQLPPKYSYNPESLENFFQKLDPQFRYAVEFRNPSWIVPETDTFKLLEKYGVAYTVVDEPLLPPEVHVTTDFAYVRWHGKGEGIWFDYQYSDKELDQWVPKVKQLANKAKRVYGYFNNHYHGYAPENCLQLIEKLGIASKEQKKVKAKKIDQQAQLGTYIDNPK